MFSRCPRGLGVTGDMRTRITLAALVGLATFGIPTITAASAEATAGGAAPGRAVSMAPSARQMVRPRQLSADELKFDLRRASAPARTASLTGPAPACYGDSRQITPVGGTLDPSSFGAFYNCNQKTWTFEVSTADSWTASSFGAWVIAIETDTGSMTCDLPEYEAAVVQVSPGHFVGEVLAFNMVTCDPTSPTETGTASWALTSTGVSLTFSSSALGGGNTLAWNGGLFTYTELQDGTNGDGVPSPTFVDGGVAEGLILDSVPPSASPPPECTAASAPSDLLATTPNSARAAAALRRAGFHGVHDFGEGVVAFSGDGPKATAALAAAGMTSRVSPNPTRSIQSVAVNGAGTTTPPNDPFYANGTQWNLGAINAPGAWAVTTGTNVVVADIDTGVDFNQSDLTGSQLVAGIDETTNPPTPINASSGNTDTQGHGTAVAGVIAAATNNGNELASLGWNTSVMPIKASTNGSFTSAAIVAGINYAVGHGAKVINLSLGGPCPDSAEETAVESAISAGVLVVAAAGNGALTSALNDGESDSDYYSYPAAYPGVVAVGATGADGYRAAYSNTGPYVSMVAPGGGNDNSSDCITVLTTTGGVACEVGTSFAAPQVAAAAALIRSANPNLTLSQVRELLESTTTGLGPLGTNIEYGTGNPQRQRRAGGHAFGRSRIWDVHRFAAGSHPRYADRRGRP